MKRSYYLLGLMVVLVLAGTIGVAWSEDTPSTVGVVDMERVANEYAEMQQLNREFQTFLHDQDQKLQRQHTARMLKDDERQEYLDSTEMGAPTDGMKARLKELEELSASREKRMLELGKTEECTEEEQTELAELEALYNQRMDNLAQLQAEIQASRLAKYDELTQLVTENVDGAVKKVAEAQQLTIVVRKESVLHGGLDITDDVLQELNSPASSEDNEEAEE
ncbi:MAG: OmpH family outer membrane protein [Armatimonadetes bacterium]|nr:OmpH family outer membrane protein [Armatimonadota bacterium]